MGRRLRPDGRDRQPAHRAAEPVRGQTFEFGLQVLAKPAVWPWVLNPFRPSWGEPFSSIADADARRDRGCLERPPSGDVVLVSHQLPIWMVQRSVTGRRLFHDPRRRRCALSSITTLAREPGIRSRTSSRSTIRNPRQSWQHDPSTWERCEDRRTTHDHFRSAAGRHRDALPDAPPIRWPSSTATAAMRTTSPATGRSWRSRVRPRGAGGVRRARRMPVARCRAPTTPATCSWSTSGRRTADRAASRLPTSRPCRKATGQGRELPRRQHRRPAGNLAGVRPQVRGHLPVDHRRRHRRRPARLRRQHRPRARCRRRWCWTSKAGSPRASWVRSRPARYSNPC